MYVVLTNDSFLLTGVNILFLDRINKPPNINIIEPTTVIESLFMNIILIISSNCILFNNIEFV